MPAHRLANRRRRSSHALLGFTPAKPGIYGITPNARPVPVTFAPNVTPISYTSADPDDDTDPSSPLSSYALAAALGNPSASGLITSKLFPPSATPAPPPTRKRCPPGKRRSQGYIPRPPNAFMLFRADFVRQKHVPGSIETNHGSLSKIIGTCWRQLPLEEKRVWELKAKQEKAAHKAMFPDYRFRPVHNKNKHANASSSSSSTSPGTTTSDESRRKEKQPTTEEDERRCDEVAALLLEGKKGEELARAVRDLDRQREEEERERELREMEEYDLDVDLGTDDLPLPTPHDDGSAALRMPAPSFIDPFANSQFASNTHMYLPNATSFLPPPPPNAMYHRRSSSVPLPNDWHPHNFSQFSTFTQGTNASTSSGIALPTLPAFTSLSRPVSPVGSIARFTTQTQFTNPFSSSHNANTNGNGNGEYEFLPIPEFTPAGSSFPSTAPSSSCSSSSPHSIPPYTPTTQIHHPQPTPLPLLPFMTQTTPRSSLGLGQRRASSAQGVLMRGWSMPLGSMGGMGSMGGVNGMGGMNGMGYEQAGSFMHDNVFDYSMDFSMPLNMPMDMSMNMNMGMGMGVGAVQRDPSPLPDVESGLFSDFSFGSSTSSSSSNSTVPASSTTSPSSHPSSASLSSASFPSLSSSTPASTSTSTSTGGASPHAHAHTHSTSLSKLTTEFSFSPTELPPDSALSPSPSPSSSSASSPLSAGGALLPETPSTGVPPASVQDVEQEHPVDATAATASSADSNAQAGTEAEADRGRLPSLDISAYMHLDAHLDVDGLYAGDAYGFDGHWGVDPVDKRSGAESVGVSGGGAEFACA